MAITFHLRDFLLSFLSHFFAAVPAMFVYLYILLTMFPSLHS